MANPTPVDIAKWAVPMWPNTRDQIIATTIGMVGASRFNTSAGIWGKGGTPGDGPSQAAAALTAWGAQGWKAFPERGTGQAALYWPLATAAVAEAALIAPAAAAVKGGQAVVASVTDIPGAISGAVDKLTNGLAIVAWLTTPNAWVRITKVAVGIGLVFIGSGMISLSTVSAPFMNLLGKADDTAAAQAGLVNGRNP